MASQGVLIGKGVKVGIAGAGVFGGYHAHKYQHHEEALLTCVYDVDQQAAVLFAEKFGCVHVPDFDDFLNRVDAVIITVPAHYHAALAIRALKNKKHVFVEKPVALDVGDAQTMIGLAQAHGLSLQVGHQERYVADAMGLLSLPEKPHSIKCRRCMPQTGRGEDVSVVMDLMIHDLDIVAQYSDQASPAIMVDRAFSTDHKVSADLLFKSSDKTFTASLIASRRSDKRERSLGLCFENGEIWLDFLQRTIRNTTPYALENPFQNNTGAKKSNGQLALTDPLAFGVNDFLRSIQTKTSPMITGQDGAVALKWALQIENEMHNTSSPPIKVSSINGICPDGTATGEASSKEALSLAKEVVV